MVAGFGVEPRGGLARRPSSERMASLPRRRRPHRPDLAVRNQLPQPGGRGRAGHAELDVGGGVARRIALEDRVRVGRGSHAEPVVAMPDPMQRRGRQKRPRGIEVEAIAVEQPQRVVLHRHAGPSVEQLVTSAPQRDAGVAAAAEDDRARFPVQHAQVIRLPVVAVARQRELLPDHNAELVALLEKRGLVDDRPAPATQEVEIRPGKKIELLAVALCRKHAGKNFRADPVGATREDRTSVDFKRDRHRRLGRRVSGARELVGGHDEPDAAQPDALLACLHSLPIRVERFDDAGVKRGVAFGVRPPEHRLVQADRERAGRTFLLGHHGTGGVAQRPAHARGAPAGHQPQVGRRKVVGKVIGDFDKVEPCPGIPDFEIRLVPDPERDQPRMKIPPVGDGGLAGLAAFLPFAIRDFFGGHGNLRGRCDEDFHEPPVGHAGQIDFKRREHPFLRVDIAALDADRARVVHPAADEHQAMAGLQRGLLDPGLINPTDVFHPAVGEEMVRLPIRRPPFRPRPIKLHRPRHHRRNKSFGRLVGARCPADLPAGENSGCCVCFHGARRFPAEQEGFPRVPASHSRHTHPCSISFFSGSRPEVA